MGGALLGRVVVHVVVDVLLMLCGFGQGADWYDTLVLCILSLHLYRTVHLWYIFVHTSIVPFMWGGGLYVVCVVYGCSFPGDGVSGLLRVRFLPGFPGINHTWWW